MGRIAQESMTSIHSPQPTRSVARWIQRENVARCLAWLLALLLQLGMVECLAQDDERAKNEEAALQMWPEAGDPQSVMGREVQRLLDHYEATRDPRLKQVTAPMWIASQAAANTERARTEAESQQSAMRLYPELAVLDSPLNRLFRETHARYKEVKPEYFTDPRWPIKLAQQCALQLDARRAIGSLPSPKADAGENVGPNEKASGDPAETTPRPWRKWLVNSLLIVIGAALVFAIIRRALRIRKSIPDEEDGSSI